jgi:hypothetical protein
MGRVRVQREVSAVDSQLFADGRHVYEETVKGESCPMGMSIPSSQIVDIISISQSIEKGHPPLKPNTEAFTACLRAWAASDRRQEGGHFAHRYFCSSYSHCRIAVSYLDNIPDDDRRDVEGVDDAQDTGLTPNARTYSMVMNAWANASNAEQGRGAVSRCEVCLNKMERRGAVDSAVRPNLIACVTSITCWARTRCVVYATSRAENILNHMLDLYYRCYARSSDPYGTEHRKNLTVPKRLLASPIRRSETPFNAMMDIGKIRRSSKCHCGVRQDENYEHKWRFGIRQYDSKRIRKV